MAVKHLFLALLTQHEMHGYELKNAFEEMVSGNWPLNFGQVYQTLGRLERDGLVESSEIAQDEKPDKKVYRVTNLGIEHFYEWLKEEDEWNLFFDELALRMMAFTLIDSATSLETLRSYRSFLFRVIKSLTQMRDQEKNKASMQVLLIERNIFKAEADLKWVTSMIERWVKND